MTQTKHIERHEAGDTEILEVIVPDGDHDDYDPDNDLANQPRKDISGATIEWYLKEDTDGHVDDADAELEKTTGGGGVEIINAIEGEAEVIIDGTTDTTTGDTATLVPANQSKEDYDHVCRVTVDGERSTVFAGSFEIVAN